MMRALCSAAAVLTLSACSSNPPAPTTAGTNDDSATATSTAAVADGSVPALDRAGWTESVYKTLTETIIGSAGQGKIVVFDFDNTTQARDIGEAVLAQVQQAKVIDPASLSPAMFPPFTTSGGEPMTITEGVSDYYDAVLDSAGDADPFREYSSLPMPATAFTGRTLADFLAQTATVYDNGAGAKDLTSKEESTILGAGRPFIYPQMADLYGNLRSNGYDVWVVSAGVGWAVRWMVQNAVNPAIVAKYGPDAALPMDHVVAITTLLKDRETGKLVSDYQLTHQTPDARYINLEPTRMSQLEITAIPDGLASWRGGKAGAIDNIITRGELFMVAGDSMGDVEMLARATNRLVVSRMNKPALAEGFADEIAKAPDANWMLQPTINSAPVGFLETKCQMAEKTAGNADLTATTDKSLGVLDGTGRLGSFTSC
jgi:phosphoserine phosphatase